MAKPSDGGGEDFQRVVDCLPQLLGRMDDVRRMEETARKGLDVPGVVLAKDFRRTCAEQHVERTKEGEREREEEKRVRSLNCWMVDPGEEEAAPSALLASWRAESEGWLRVECVLDSGASESVCPATMAPMWPIRESAGSRVGLHYTSASGGRLPNQGEQHLPIALENGVCSSAIFQVADVSRPLIGVGRVCEMGNRVIFGASGGVIHNIQTGRETRFERKDGVYVFPLWIPPTNLAQGFTGQP